MYNQGLSPMTRDLGDTEIMMPVHTKGMHVTCHHKMSLYSSSNYFINTCSTSGTGLVEVQVRFQVAVHKWRDSI